MEGLLGLLRPAQPVGWVGQDGRDICRPPLLERNGAGPLTREWPQYGIQSGEEMLLSVVDGSCSCHCCLSMAGSLR